MNADAILSIPLTLPNALFPRDLDEAKKKQRALASEWHPDRNTNPLAGKVLAHINALFARAEVMIQDGTMPSSHTSHVNGDHIYQFTTKEGQHFRLRYLKHHPFELGDLYIARQYILYYVRPEFHDLADHMINSIRFQYLTKEFEKEHARYLPKLDRKFHTLDGGRVIVLRNRSEFMLLKDMLDHFGGSLEPKHAAWIMSALYNINCYLQIAKITHNDIGPHSIFVNARDHEVMLIGGWWYSGKVGKKPLAVPARTMDVSKDFTTKAVDASLIRLTGKEICGSQLLKAPPTVARWIRGLGTDDSIEEYKAWHKMLETAFGPRRFAELVVPDNIY